MSKPFITLSQPKEPALCPTVRPPCRSRDVVAWCAGASTVRSRMSRLRLRSRGSACRSGTPVGVSTVTRACMTGPACHAGLRPPHRRLPALNRPRGGSAGRRHQPHAQLHLKDGGAAPCWPPTPSRSRGSCPGRSRRRASAINAASSAWAWPSQRARRCGCVHHGARRSEPSWRPSGLSTSG